MLVALLDAMQIPIADRDLFVRAFASEPILSTEGAGTSAGVAAVSGVGASTFAGVGASAGAGAASGVGASTFAGVGASAGVGAASGVGEAVGGGRATIGVSTKTSGSDTTGGVALTTASVSFSANALAIAIISSAAGITPDAPTLTGGGMTTWTQVLTNNYVAGNRRYTVFRSMQASPGASAPLVFSFGVQSQTSTCHAVLQFTDVNTGGTNGADAIVQTSTTTTGAGQGSITATALAALEFSGNEILAIASADINGSMTEDADFTELTDNAISSGNITLETSHATNQTTNTTTFSGNTSSGAGISLIEIKAA